MGRARKLGHRFEKRSARAALERTQVVPLGTRTARRAGRADGVGVVRRVLRSGGACRGARLARHRPQAREGRGLARGDTRPRGAASFSEGQERFAQLARTQDVLVQPYLSSVATYGERALIFFDGRYSHAVVKKPFDTVLVVGDAPSSLTQATAYRAGGRGRGPRGRAGPPALCASRFVARRRGSRLRERSGVDRTWTLFRSPRAGATGFRRCHRCKK